MYTWACGEVVCRRGGRSYSCFPRLKEEKGDLAPENRKCKGPEAMSSSKDGKRSVSRG